MVTVIVNGAGKNPAKFAVSHRAPLAHVNRFVIVSATTSTVHGPMGASVRVTARNSPQPATVQSGDGTTG
jgi:hypothetical protein